MGNASPSETTGTPPTKAWRKKAARAVWLSELHANYHALQADVAQRRENSAVRAPRWLQGLWGYQGRDMARRHSEYLNKKINSRLKCLDIPTE